MATGAYSSISSYDKSGTQSLAVTDTLSGEDKVMSVFWNKNDTTKQLIHGTHTKQIPSTISTKDTSWGGTQIFDIDKNVDALGNLYVSIIIELDTPGAQLDPGPPKTLTTLLRRPSAKEAITSWDLTEPLMYRTRGTKKGAKKPEGVQIGYPNGWREDTNSPNYPNPLNNIHPFMQPQDLPSYPNWDWKPRDFLQLRELPINRTSRQTLQEFLGDSTYYGNTEKEYLFNPDMRVSKHSKLELFNDREEYSLGDPRPMSLVMNGIYSRPLKESPNYIGHDSLISDSLVPSSYQATYRPHDLSYIPKYLSHNDSKKLRRTGNEHFNLNSDGNIELYTSPGNPASDFFKSYLSLEEIKKLVNYYNETDVISNPINPITTPPDNRFFTDYDRSIPFDQQVDEFLGLPGFEVAPEFGSQDGKSPLGFPNYVSNHTFDKGEYLFSQSGEFTSLNSANPPDGSYSICLDKIYPIADVEDVSPSHQCEDHYGYATAISKDGNTMAVSQGRMYGCEQSSAIQSQIDALNINSAGKAPVSNPPDTNWPYGEADSTHTAAWTAAIQAGAILFPMNPKRAGKVRVYKKNGDEWVLNKTFSASESNLTSYPRGAKTIKRPGAQEYIYRNVYNEAFMEGKFPLIAQKTPWASGCKNHISLNRDGTRLVIGEAGGPNNFITTYDYTGGNNWNISDITTHGAAAVNDEIEDYYFLGVYTGDNLYTFGPNFGFPDNPTYGIYPLPESVWGSGFGNNVEMSSDGNILAVTSYLSPAKVFKWNSGSWSDMSTGITGVADSISLTDDGKTLVTSDFTTHYVYVWDYDISSETWINSDVLPLITLPNYRTLATQFSQLSPPGASAFINPVLNNLPIGSRIAGVGDVRDHGGSVVDGDNAKGHKYPNQSPRTIHEMGTVTPISSAAAAFAPPVTTSTPNINSSVAQALFDDEKAKWEARDIANTSHQTWIDYFAAESAADPHRLNGQLDNLLNILIDGPGIGGDTFNSNPALISGDGTHIFIRGARVKKTLTYGYFPQNIKIYTKESSLPIGQRVIPRTMVVAYPPSSEIFYNLNSGPMMNVTSPSGNTFEAEIIPHPGYDMPANYYEWDYSTNTVVTVTPDWLPGQLATGDHFTVEITTGCKWYQETNATISERDVARASARQPFKVDNINLVTSEDDIVRHNSEEAGSARLAAEELGAHQIPCGRGEFSISRDGKRIAFGTPLSDNGFTPHLPQFPPQLMLLGASARDIVAEMPMSSSWLRENPSPLSNNWYYASNSSIAIKKAAAGNIKIYEKDNSNSWIELLGDISGESGEKNILDSHSHVSPQTFPELFVTSRTGFFTDSGEILDVGPDADTFTAANQEWRTGGAAASHTLGITDQPYLYPDGLGGASFATPTGLVGQLVTSQNLTISATCVFRSFGSNSDPAGSIRPPIITIGTRDISGGVQSAEAYDQFAIHQMHTDAGIPGLREWDLIGVTYGPHTPIPTSTNGLYAALPDITPFYARRGEEHWYVLTKDAEIISFYVDGQLIGSHDYTNSTAPPWSPAYSNVVFKETSFIGTRRTRGRGSSINGVIRDVGVWTGALSATEVASMYYGGSNGEVSLVSGASATLEFTKFQKTLSLGETQKLAIYNSIRYGGELSNEWNQSWHQYGGIDFITNYFSVYGGLSTEFNDLNYSDNDSVYSSYRGKKYSGSRGEGLGWSIDMSGDGKSIVSGAPYMSTIGTTVANPRRSYKCVGRSYIYNLEKIDKSIKTLPKKIPGKLRLTFNDAFKLVNDAQRRLNHDITDFFNISFDSYNKQCFLNWKKQWDTVPDQAVDPPVLDDYTNPYWAKSNLKQKVNIPLSKIIKNVQFQVGTQIWQTLENEDMLAIHATELTESAYKSLQLQCSGLVRSDGTKETFGDSKWVPGKKYQAIIPIPLICGNPDGKFKTYTTHRQDSYLNCLAMEQIVKIKIEYAKVEDIFDTTDVYAYQGYSAPIYTLSSSDTRGNYITNVPEIWNPNIKLRTSLYGEYIKLSEEEKDMLKTKKDKLYKRLKTTQSVIFNSFPEVLHRNTFVDIKLDTFSIYSSHLIISLNFPGILINIPYLESAEILLNGTTHSGIVNSNRLLTGAKSLGLYSNNFALDKEELDTMYYVFPLGSKAFGGSSIALNRFDDINLRLFFTANGGIPDEGIIVPKSSKIKIVCRGETNLYYNNGISSISLF